MVRKLMTKNQTKRSGVIDLGDYTPGIYILQVVTPEGVQVADMASALDAGDMKDLLPAKRYTLILALVRQMRVMGS